MREFEVMIWTALNTKDILVKENIFEDEPKKTP
jgi:hypothetical protein